MAWVKLKGKKNIFGGGRMIREEEWPPRTGARLVTIGATFQVPAQVKHESYLWRWWNVSPRWLTWNYNSNSDCECFRYPWQRNSDTNFLVSLVILFVLILLLGCSHKLSDWFSIYLYYHKKKKLRSRNPVRSTSAWMLLQKDTILRSTKKIKP